jgi:4-hydroxybenzoate polyprenyltransferase
MGAWAAVRGSLFTLADLPAWILLAVVTLWIGGFDLIYACQDVPYDQQDGLHSIPARFGIAAALTVSAVSHVITVLLLLALGSSGLSWPYWVGLLAVAVMLAWEHSLVHPNDLSRVDVAFFNVNSYISITLFLSILGALYVR